MVLSYVSESPGGFVEIQIIGLHPRISGLTPKFAGGSTFQMAPSHSCWQEALIPCCMNLSTWLLAYSHNIAAGFPQSRWSKKAVRKDPQWPGLGSQAPSFPQCLIFKKLLLKYSCHHNILWTRHISPIQDRRDPPKDVKTRRWESLWAGYHTQFLSQWGDSFSALSLNYFHLVSGQSLISKIFIVIFHFI